MVSKNEWIMRVNFVLPEVGEQTPFHHLLSARHSFIGMEKETSVKVAVRVRPFIGIERVKQSKTIIQCPSSKEVLVSGSDAGPEKRFTFDFVYDQDSTQVL